MPTKEPMMTWLVHHSSGLAGTFVLSLAFFQRFVRPAVGTAFHDGWLFVLSAARRTDNRPMRHHLGVQKLRFARREELLTHTGLEPGCVPPFGHPLFNLPVYVDASLAAGEEIAFTAADHRLSIRMAMGDYLAVARPAGIFDFSRD